MCEDEGCVAFFPTQSDLQVHMDTGRHIMVMERESIYDLARKKWAEKVKGVQLLHFAGKGGVTQEGSGTVTLSRKEPPQGWALSSASFKTESENNRLAAPETVGELSCSVTN